MTTYRHAKLLVMGWLGGIGASAVLLFASLSKDNLPPGCGPGGGCAAVLDSRWSTILGMPVSIPAIVIYCAAFVAFETTKRRPDSTLAQFALATAAGAVAAAALWFTALQIFAIRAMCPWCVTAHAFGLLFCIAAVRLLWCRENAARVCARGVASGIVMVTALALTQVVCTTQSSEFRVSGGSGVGSSDRLPPIIEDAISQPLPESTLPRLGAVAPERSLYLLFDYACPHCRQAHTQLREVLQSDPGLRVYVLPVPLHPDCNPHLADEIGSRFAESCDLAKIALEVWLAAPEHFAGFDAWLFATDLPRTSQEATNRAEAIIGPSRTTKPQDVTALLELGVAVYGASAQRGHDRLPILVLADDSLVSGRFENAASLHQLIRNEDMSHTRNQSH